jgi:pimeloyl-ACP methyl ester carboxylesterase
MGGAIAMLYALTYPELLDGLILVATGAKLRVFPEILQGVLVDKEGTVRKIAEYAFSKKTTTTVIESGFKEMMKCRKEQSTATSSVVNSSMLWTDSRKLLYPH